MFMTIQEFMKKTRLGGRIPWLRPGVVCNDGFSISVQASESHYCYPRESYLDEYNCVELGFPNKKDELIMSYAEDPEKPTRTVYGYVPISIVQQLMDKHGGIKTE